MNESWLRVKRNCELYCQ